MLRGAEGGVSRTEHRGNENTTDRGIGNGNSGYGERELDSSRSFDCRILGSNSLTEEESNFSNESAWPDTCGQLIDHDGVTSRFAQNRTLRGMGRGIRDFHKHKSANGRSPTRQMWRLPVQNPLSKAIRKVIPSCMGLAVQF